MKKRFRTLVFVPIAILLLALLFSLPIYAGDDPEPPSNLDGRAVCLYDITHSKYIVLKNEEELLNTSTSAKVMMGLIACELLSERLDEIVVITEDMIKGASGYSLALSVGENIKIKDLLYGAICGSYNDAAYATAYICAGSIEEFVSLMNERAANLGAGSTRYTNPIGYPDNAAMVTTLSDTLKISVAASENELFMTISSATKHDVQAITSGKARTIYNRNYLVCARTSTEYYNPVCKGMNAGNTGSDGGWSIITLAEDDGAKYICILLGGGETDTRITAYDTVNTLVNWACGAYNSRTVFEKGHELGETTVHLTALGSSKAKYVTAEPLTIYIPDHSKPSITYNVEMTSQKLKAPILSDTEIGTVYVYCNGELAGECPVVLTEDYELSPIMMVIDKLSQYTQSRAFVATAIAFAILLPISIFITKNRSQYGGRYKKMR